MQRREFFGATAAVAAACLTSNVRAAEKDVPWLKEIQQRPEKLPTNAPTLSDLLVDAAGKRIETVEAWKPRRAEILAWWTKFLGKMPAERNPAKPPALKVLEEDKIDGVIRQRVEYEVEPGLKTEAYLCRPEKLTGQAPGVVCFHSTVDHSIRQPAGLGPDPQKAFGLKFAKQGRIVLSPRCFAWPTNDKLQAKEETAKYLARVPNSLGMAKMLYDSLVAVDILAQLDGVDPQRLGAVGHSLGAKEVLYLAAFDERIKATVSSEGGIGVRFSNWNAPWYLGPAIDEPGFARDQHELLALCAPRPFLLIGGESADGDRGWPFIAAALPVYRLYGPRVTFGQWNHRQGHAVPPIAEERIEEWFAIYL
ncbi:dienelactone hydrolase family protein [Anatilimnocola floriformis]|uniref:dienelactone hydrolase family protein n=1 Tax=Anatilimnocola floriformis TaxID=2948575 RepID=UPI0020C47671|nr:dienelactone hydrolase family protein [Anatilimnocola floriformis]